MKSSLMTFFYQQSAFLKSLSPFRWFLVSLFFILILTEFTNGVTDLGVVIAPILLILLLNQYYLLYRSQELENDPPIILESVHFHALNKGSKARKSIFLFLNFCLKIFRSIKYELFVEDPRLSLRQRAIKLLMNNLFLLIFVMAFMGSFFNGLQEDFKLWGIFVWSFAFLGLNIKEFIKTLSYARLFMANLGLFFVLGSVALIVASP